MHKNTPAEIASAAPRNVPFAASELSTAKNNNTPIGHIAANDMFATIRERRDQPDEAISVVIDIASSGLCRTIAINVAKPATKVVPLSDISLWTLAANAMPSISV